jgi:hypothetical protein
VCAYVTSFLARSPCCLTKPYLLHEELQPFLIFIPAAIIHYKIAHNDPHVLERSPCLGSINPDTVSFLRYAAEIRNRIYELLFEYNTPIPLASETQTDTRSSSCASISGVGLLSTCCLVNMEASGILHVRNYFELSRIEYPGDTRAKLSRQDE